MNLKTCYNHNRTLILIFIQTLWLDWRFLCFLIASAPKMNKKRKTVPFWSASSDSNTHLCSSGPRCQSHLRLLGSPFGSSGWSGCLAASSSWAGMGEWSDSPARPGYQGEAATGTTRTLQTHYNTFSGQRRITEHVLSTNDRWLTVWWAQCPLEQSFNFMI